MSTLLSRRSLLKSSLVAAGAALAGCAPKVVKETVVVKEVVKETVQVEVEKVVKEAVEVEKEVTRVVEKVVEQKPAEKAAVEIRVQRTSDNPWEQEAHKQFQELFPHIKVAPEPTPGADYWTKLRTSFAGGRLGDTFWTWQENGDFNQYEASGMITSCQPYVDAEKYDTSLFFQSAISLFVVEGNLMLIPEYAHPGPTGVYVNKAMCDEAGITYVPETNAREADIYDDWTLEEFVEVTKRLTKRDSSGKVTRWGYARYAGFHQIVSMMRRSGGDALAPDRKTVIVDSDESINGIRYEDDLFHQHQVRPTPDAETDNPRNLFINGLAASFCHGAASATQLKRLLADKFDYVGVLIPRHSEKDTRGLILSTGGNCISSQSKSPDAAWEYCKFMGSQQIGVLRTVMGGAGPGGRPDVWYDERIQSYHRVIPKFAELIPQAKPHVIPWNNRASEYQDAVTQNIDKIWLGNVTVEEGCKLAAEAARKVMAQDPI